MQIGDLLRTYSNKDKEFVDFQVKRISYELKEGFIAPLTNEGTLLVNQVDTSCYAEVNSHQMGELAMAPVKLWYKLNKLFTNTIVDKGSDHDVGVNLYSKLLYKFGLTFFPSFIN